MRLSGKPNPSTRDFIEHSGRGTLREFPLFTGGDTGSASASRPLQPLVSQILSHLFKQ
jgi:hypothetical protein